MAVNKIMHNEWLIFICILCLFNVKDLTNEYPYLAPGSPGSTILLLAVTVDGEKLTVARGNKGTLNNSDKRKFRLN